MLVVRSNVSQFCEAIRNQKRIVFTNGCFDLLHVGHVRYLQEARALGDYLFVGLNSDSSVKAIKGPTRPVQTQEDRAEILLALKSVDAVSLFSEETPLELLKLVKPQFLVKGADWDINKIVGKDFVESYGGQVKQITFVPGRSTSNIISKL